jgi:LysR family transcriptional regulator, glycine cleavage system transcriptional activator
MGLPLALTGPDLSRTTRTGTLRAHSWAGKLSASKLKAFHLAGMTGSFKHAAHLLCITPSAVSARVRSLETDLGVRLFKRGIRKLTLTEAGAEYIREVEATFANLEMATRELRSRFGAGLPAR